MFIEVILPLPVDRAYTYEVPEAWSDLVLPGSRVLVPFGPRQLSGLVTAVVSRPKGVKRMRAILEVLDDGPALTEELLDLTRWVGRYYACSWGEAARAALPPGIEVASRMHVRLVDPKRGDSSGVEAAVIDYLAGRESAAIRTVEQTVAGANRALLRRMELDGSVETFSSLAPASVRVRTEKFVQPAALDTPLPKGIRQRAVLEILQTAPDGLFLKDLIERSGASHGTVSNLAKQGHVEVEDREVSRNPVDPEGADDVPPIRADAFHPSQLAAANRIIGAVDAGSFEAFLLHGVTGSGKTEVYIAALQRVREQGRGGIVLVPEIALTPQTVRRFRRHFGNEVAVLHSRMAQGERYDAWRGIQRGDHHLVVGPRSAVFAPIRDLGLIVVDEEHESSYKQFDPAPRYHARDVALVRARSAGAVCVLGSATPSLESIHNARIGKYTLLSMPDRVPAGDLPAARLPEVRIVDLTLEHREGRLEGALSRPMRAAIQERLTTGHQIILLRNRRGYASVLECTRCGWTPKCPDCSVTMTFHKAHRQLRCHYCARVDPMRLEAGAPVCGSCSSTELGQLGAGTQRVEEELSAAFPTARVVRMDLDTTRRKDAHDRILSRFGRGEADVLIGTQMVAKGLDFGRVTLVGVIDADAGMLFPDFRSEERTFQLLAQVSGRAGRAQWPGEVLLQTRNPRHPVIQMARRHDYEGFVAAALPVREEFGYPPFGRLVRVEFRGRDERAVANVADRWAAVFATTDPGLRVLGPAPAFIARVKQIWRYHALVKAPLAAPPSALRDALQRSLSALGNPPVGVRINLDIDPVGLI